MTKVTNDSTIDYIIGLPPGGLTDDVINGRTQTVMENSMPIARIYPGVPSFTEGLNIFTRRPAFRSGSGNIGGDLSYLSLLNSHGYGLKQPNHTSNAGSDGCLVVAYLADSFPTDSFSNEYGENFLKGFTNILSEGAASIVQFTGARTAGEFGNTLVNRLKGGGVASNLIASGMQGGMDIASSITDAMFSDRANTIRSTLLAGGRLDFPMVWKGSSFQPSYTMTIRLYNPNPGDPRSTKKYIAAPIAALMLLGSPISVDNVTYNFPFIHKISSPGIYDLDPAFISNITIIKGGDQHQVAYNQQLGVVDVRVDFGSLYSSLLASRSKNVNRPTLDSYLNAMVGVDSVKGGVKNFSSTGITPQMQLDQDDNNLYRSSEIKKTKNQASTTTELTEEEIYSPSPRVSIISKEQETILSGSTPGSFLN